MGIPLLKGRDFNERDSQEISGVAIVNETLAHRLWPSEEVIGKRLRDVKYRSLREDPTPFIYVPLGHSDMIYALVRTRGGPQALLRVAENEIHVLDENMVVKSRTLDELVQSTLWLPRMSATVAGGFSLLGLLLATIGLYGVISYSVTCRTKEIGIRMALGAAKSDVIKLIMRQGLALTLLGTVLGIGAALAVAPLLQGLLYGVSPADRLTYVTASVVLATVALLASYIPVALRHE
ncbi:MAG: hypothetical protein DMG05_17990 [Acidobacteria bacterium]|nr:MAG: hypothetical protein DMG05_17990 [Acidobacteriota bacterium]